MLGLKLQEAFHQSVVFRIGDLRAIQDIIAKIVMPDLLAQFFYFYFYIHAHRPKDRRSASMPGKPACRIFFWAVSMS